MRFAVLGPLLLTTPDEITIERHSHRRLLSILLFEAGHALETDVLIDRYWGEEPPPTARAALQTHLSQLRRRLPAGLIITTGSGYLLDLGVHDLDRTEFEERASAARLAYESAAWDEAVDAAEGALGVWRGRPFLELQDDEFAMPEIGRLEELRTGLIEMRAEALLAVGRNEQALPDLERFVREFPYRERLWEHLMLARARVGRTADALTAYHEARAGLAELGLEPGPALRELEGRILREDPIVVRPRIRHNLPRQLTSFVGRASERAELASLLESRRMVTLIGPGGAGKTRLAIEVANELTGRFPDGVWLIDLAPLDDPGLVVDRVAVTVGLRPERQSVRETVSQALRNRATLVVLDNCEHLRGAAADVARLALDSGPGVHVAATSRQALDVAGETVVEVSTMPVPAEGVNDVAEVRANDAVQLFQERAESVAHGFAITGDNATVVARICRTLDGMPLAIELAAARMSAMSPHDLAERLDDRFRLLTRSGVGGPSRHQTLEAAVAWSYDDLSDAERTLLARLSVFSGSVDLGMVEIVCGFGPIARRDVAALLSRLVEKSLVQALDGTRHRRYRMLETVRQFSSNRRAEPPGEHDVGRRHAEAYAELADRLARDIRTPDQVDAFGRFADDHDNFRAALAWARDEDEHELMVRLVASMMPFWEQAGHFSEGHAWFKASAIDDPRLPVSLRVRALTNSILLLVSVSADDVRKAGDLAVQLAEDPAVDARLRAEARAWRGFALYYHRPADRPDAWHRDMRAALRAANAAGDEWVIGKAKALLGLHEAMDRRSRSFALLDQALEHFRHVGDRLNEVTTLWFLGLASVNLHRREARSVRQCQEAARLARDLGSRLLEVHARIVEGRLWVDLGEPARGRDLMRQGFGELGEMGDLWCRSLEARRLARLEVDVDERRARDLLAEAIDLSRKLGQHENLAFATGLAGKLAARKGDALRATTLFAAANAHLDESGRLQLEGWLDPELIVVREELTPAAYARARERGASMRLEDASRVALE
jgi:predicted ATPase